MILRRGAVAIYQLTSATRNRDISAYSNPPARFVDVYYSRGPDNHPQGALGFRTRNSHILIPNNGCLDTRYSITILFWFFAEITGPLVHFNPNGRGVDVGIDRQFRFYAHFLPRSGKYVPPVFKRISPRRWIFAGATYNHVTGIATVWINSIPVVQSNIGRFRSGLATGYPIVIGQKPGVTRRFRGKISCLQIFNYDMNGAKITSKMKWCFRSGRFSRIVMVFLLFYHFDAKSYDLLSKLI